jgi:thiol-disulfide isomerase/thioredoxin
VTPLRRRRALQLIALTGAFGALPRSDAAPAYRVRLPDVTLLDASVLKADSLAGKPVVVYFWASWCPYCAQQSPYVESLYRRTRATDLQILAVSIDKAASDAQDYLKNKGYTFPVTMDAVPIARALGTDRALPRTYVIGRSGLLTFRELGEMLGDDVLALAKFAA